MEMNASVDGADPNLEMFRVLLAQARVQVDAGDRDGFARTVTAFARASIEPFVARLLDLDDEVAERPSRRRVWCKSDNADWG